MKIRPAAALLFAGILPVMLCTACIGSSNPKEPPEIQITANKTDIGYVVGKNVWNGAKIDREDNFHVIMGKTNREDISLFRWKKIEITFSNNSPDTLTFEVYSAPLLNSRPYQSNQPETITLRNGKGSIPVKAYLSPDEGLDSDNELSDYRFFAKWGNNSCEYTVIIKTDQQNGVIS